MLEYVDKCHNNVMIKCYHNVSKCYTKLHINVTLPYFAMLRNATQMLQITAQMSPLLNTQLQQWTLLSPYKFQVNFFFEFSILTTM